MKVLVYGTLRPGQSAYRMFDNPRDLGTRQINGSLYDLGWFPGVKLNTGGQFTASLIECDDSCLNRLDQYEGCPRLYTRQTLNLEDEGLCYIYEYNGDVDEPRRIKSGDWFNHHGSR